MKSSVITRGPEETCRLGCLLASSLIKGDVVALRGELGVGKTCFTQGIARGLAVPEEELVTSPSFTIVNEYRGRLILYHVDVYRFSDAAELMNIGYEEFFFGDGVTVIEWADKVMELIPSHAFLIDFFYVDDNSRQVCFSGPESRMEGIKKSITEGGFAWL
ncbi:MAG: tRNA (adenosine(37)-N6)-threonylcarbamoyltransferase complex ATPase subunit type 1 TsaE [Syntrophales bacterium]|nr:tRNA (adenosine(37)-N6)-threonylcarbamoyltransferase complex ATPase subunit type 1 TsaE [Syntrophales bacterium]